MYAYYEQPESSSRQDEPPPKRQRMWTERAHRDFVSAIFDIGLKQASPSVIMENMMQENEAVTSERVKSHLQKYRKNKDKSKAEFLAEYDGWLQKALTLGAAGGRLAPAEKVADLMSQETILGGNAPAFLTYMIMAEEDQDDQSGDNSQSADPLTASSQQVSKYLTGTRIPFPVLTEEERKSPLGASMCHVLALFYSMTHHLANEREFKTDEPPVQTPPVWPMQTSTPARELMQHIQSSTHVAPPPQYLYAPVAREPPVSIEHVDYRQHVMPAQARSAHGYDTTIPHTESDIEPLDYRNV
jgi:SHAQKYF class myb-like DNA-binding protein